MELNRLVHRSLLQMQGMIAERLSSWERSGPWMEYAGDDSLLSQRTQWRNAALDCN